MDFSVITILTPQDIGGDEVVVAVSEPTKFLYKECVNWTIEPFEVVSPALFLKFFSSINSISFKVVKINQQFT